MLKCKGGLPAQALQWIQSSGGLASESDPYDPHVQTAAGTGTACDNSKEAVVAHLPRVSQL